MTTPILAQATAIVENAEARLLAAELLAVTLELQACGLLRDDVLPPPLPDLAARRNAVNERRADLIPRLRAFTDRHWGADE